MRRIRGSYPGKSDEQIYRQGRQAFWDRRREISSSDIVEQLLGSIQWNDRTRTGTANKRVFMLKSTVKFEVRGGQLNVEFVVPVKKYEDKYADRMQAIVDTLFD